MYYGQPAEVFFVQHIQLTPDELAHLQKLIARLDAKPLTEAANRRGSERVEFNHPMWLNLPTEPGQPWVHIFSRNLSSGGLSFLTRKLFYQGQHLVISHQLHEPVPQLVLCVVKFCRAVDFGVMEVGLQFKTSVLDPENQRRVPAEWRRLVLQQDWFARSKQPAVVMASIQTR